MKEQEDWRLNGQEEFLENTVLYKIEFPQFWEKAYQTKNAFYALVEAEAQRWIGAGRANADELFAEKVQHIWHEHCAFCWEKALTNKACVFYCTTDFKHWICEECFNDFKNKFHWTIHGYDDEKN